jgi:ABC-2 type transport system permease protein
MLMLIAGLAGAISQSAPPPPPAQTVRILTMDEPLAAVAAEAIADSGRRGAAKLVIVRLRAAAADTTLLLRSDSSDRLDVVVEGRAIAPLTEALLERDLADALRQRALESAGVDPAVVKAAEAVRVRVAAAPAPATPPAQNFGPLVGRFAIVMLFWMNLVGALGMLLQAIVRERSYRALDSLLASARSSEVIFGKLLGVGVLSVIILSAWLTSGVAVAASPLGGGGQGLGPMLLGQFKDPATVLQAAAVYLVAFTMYGSAIIGLGALAKDLPAAQNLSRPVFMVLLIVFFQALTQLTGQMGPASWLVWVPPFTPFVMLMSAPGVLPPAQVAAAFVLMLLTTAAIAVAASRALTETPFRLPRRPTPPAAA